MLIVVCSGGHSPGATTAGLALTLAWPRDVLLAECDPAGGSLLSGYLVGQPQDRGLGEWAVRLRRGGDSAATLAEQVVELAGPVARRILPGLAEPAQAASVQPLWSRIAETFATASGDVIADIGRVGGSDTPNPLLADADEVLLVAQPTLRHLSALAARLTEISTLRGSAAPARVLLIGPGPYSSREVTRALGVEVADQFPRDPRATAILTHGVGNERYLPRSPLLRAARTLANGLCQRAVREGVAAS
ncbi:hypothetical protein [Spongiactinospora sp. TRM90649]|uniref:hypothetical protein n=1 Tax=Spongiactinospora sp. TRM90649 TaxID=3031114 RepID=UPI0023F84028|nr:hypothetical protein [Spongiactinospora sp. TRM90649]MDF5759046.1 hypothetical protein [Spongiactinospora sp. TRM90649]